MIDAAKAVAIPMDREVLHVLPQEFIIDDQDGIKEPLGMSGVRLEAKVHIVTGAVTSAQNIIKCCNRTGLNVADIVLEPLAVGRSGAHRRGARARRRAGRHRRRHHRHRGLSRRRGEAHRGAADRRQPRHQRHRRRAAHAVQRGRAHQAALRLRQASMATEDERVEVPSVAGASAATISRQILCEIIEPRVEEIFALVHKEIAKSGFEGRSRRASC